LAACTRADVASNTTSGRSSSESSQSTPPASAVTQQARARASPTLSGSIPAIQQGLTTGDRNSLTIRSVPMLPEPTIAARIMARR
jgi:hypothetical protein